jgi:NHL repeat
VALAVGVAAMLAPASAAAAEEYVFVTKWGSFGSGDGQFANDIGERMSGIATDAAGDVYVGDVGNDRIQRFTSDGGFVTKWGSQGSGDGQFDNPSGVAVGPDGNVYVADRWNERVQVFTPAGAFVGKWGVLGTGVGQFREPADVATDTAGNVYVADSINHRVQKFTADGAFVTEWGSVGSGPGQCNDPYGIATDGAGNVYVADTDNHRVQKFALRPPDPFAELPANDLIFVCDTRQIAIQFLERRRRVAVVDGLAASSLVGQTVELVVSGETVAQTVVGADGSFSGQVKLPKSERDVRKVRVLARVGAEQSRNVKLTRRARIMEATSTGGRTTLEGAVLTGEIERPPRLTVRRRVACEGETQWQEIATGRQRRNGTFEVSFDNPPGTVGSIFDVHTRYVMGKGSKKKRPTATFAVAIDLG